MKNSLVYITLLGVLIFGSCEKDLIEPSNEKVVFFIDALVNDANLDYRAGDNGYYMFPSFSDDTLGIRSFSGRVGHLDCDTNGFCPNSLEVLFREGEIQEGVHVGIDNSLNIGDVNFRGPASFLFQSYKAIFRSRSYPSNLSHEWFFGDGSSSTDLNPVHYYFNQKDTLVQPVLNVTNASGSCNSSISYDVNLTADCSTDIIVKKTGVFYGFSAFPAGRLDLWDFGSGYLPLGIGNPLPTGPIYKVCLKSNDTISNCIATKCENIIIDSAQVNCASNFDVEVESVLLKDVRDFSEVTMIWQNEEGHRFQSDRFDQPQSSFFEVLKIEDYKDAESSQSTSTKKVTFSFSIRLFGENESDFVDMKSDTSIIAVGYPKI